MSSLSFRDGYVFLDATLRNDWTSTLAPKNRSYLYPSVSLSWVITDMLNKVASTPEWLSFAKVRASYAEVGNDMDPYQLYNVYTMGTDARANAKPVINSQSVLYNADVKNELIRSWEAGFDVRFFDSRLGLDVSWYKTNAVNQLINLPIAAVGYSSKKINAGNIQNSGWEVVLNAEPVRTRDFLWRSTLNFATNKNLIIDLAEGVEEYSLGGYDKLKIVAHVGGEYGDIYGTKYAMSATLGVAADGTLTLIDSYVPGWGDGLDKLEGTFDAATSTLNFVCVYAGSLTFTETWIKE